MVNCTARFCSTLEPKIYKRYYLYNIEVIINVTTNFNFAIMFSFHGNIGNAVEKTNYQWLMFYPCLYFFAMWDAIREAKGTTAPFSFLPFVITAYFVTIGLIYSSKIKIVGILLGPVFLPIFFSIPGMFLGLFILKMIKQHL